MRSVIFSSLLAVALAGYSGCCCCGDYSPSRSGNACGPRRSPGRMVNHAENEPIKPAAVRVLWSQPQTPVVRVASLTEPAADEATAIQKLKQQAARLGANAITQLQVSQGNMTCEAVYIQP